LSPSFFEFDQRPIFFTAKTTTSIDIETLPLETSICFSCRRISAYALFTVDNGFRSDKVQGRKIERKEKRNLNIALDNAQNKQINFYMNTLSLI